MKCPCIECLNYWQAERHVGCWLACEKWKEWSESKQEKKSE